MVNTYVQISLQQQLCNWVKIFFLRQDVWHYLQLDMIPLYQLLGININILPPKNANYGKIHLEAAIQ